MKEGKTIKNVFTHLSKFIEELKVASKEYPPIEHTKWFFRKLNCYLITRKKNELDKLGQKE